MAVRTRTRRTDAKGRLALSPDFANALVIIDWISDNEIRIRKARVVLKRFSLEKLLAGITKENLHGEVDTGPPVGKEIW
jgi:antitoxin component of MazEF toxin-antitoxin module